jgi:hypothetical protein
LPHDYSGSSECRKLGIQSEAADLKMGYKHPPAITLVAGQISGRIPCHRRSRDTHVFNISPAESPGNAIDYFFGQSSALKRHIRASSVTTHLRWFFFSDVPPR